MSKIIVDITSSSFITLEMDGHIALWYKNPVQCTLSPAPLTNVTGYPDIVCIFG